MDEERLGMKQAGRARLDEEPTEGGAGRGLHEKNPGRVLQG